MPVDLAVPVGLDLPGWRLPAMHIGLVAGEASHAHDPLDPPPRGMVLICTHVPPQTSSSIHDHLRKACPQAGQCWRNVGAIFRADGMSPPIIAKAISFVVDDSCFCRSYRSIIGRS